MTIKNMFAYWQKLMHLFFGAAVDRKLLFSSRRFKNLITSVEGDIILCQISHAPAFFIRLIYFLMAYRQLHPQPFRLKWFVLESYLPNPQSLWKKFTFWLNYSGLLSRHWQKAHTNLGGQISLLMAPDHSDQTPWVQAKAALASVKTKKDLESLNFEGLLIGDLIYDTYLRFKPAPTVDLSDPYLLELTGWAIQLKHRFEIYFQQNSVKGFVTLFCSYVQHGIPTRVALKAGVAVYSLGAQNQLVVQPSLEFPYHKRNFHFYRTWFQGESNQEEALGKGRAILNQRLSGTIDPATQFMKTSAYSNKDQALPEIYNQFPRPRAIVMGHDFFDSPHIYGDLVFPDFMEWTEFIFQEAQKSPFKFFFKPHPNGLSDNEPLLMNLKIQYPWIEFIDPKISNMQIAQFGFDIAFTVYGTIAHEFAYLKLPVVSAGANPHMAYNLTKSVASKEELRDWIHHFPTKLWQPNSQEVEEFCYVHNKRYIDEDMKTFSLYHDLISATEVLNSSEDDNKRKQQILASLLRTNKL